MSTMREYPWFVQFSVLPGAIIQFIRPDFALLEEDYGLEQRGPLMVVDLRTGEAGFAQKSWDGMKFQVKFGDRLRIL